MKKNDILSSCDVVRLSLSKAGGGFFVSGSIELLGRITNFGIGSKLFIGNLRFYVTNITYKQSTTVLQIVTDGKILSNYKLPIGLKFTTVNKGVLEYMEAQTIENPPYTLLNISSSNSPWADTNHFSAVGIINGALNIINRINNTNYKLQTNFDYGVKDFQISKGSDVLSALRSIFPFGNQFMSVFVYNDLIINNVFPATNSEITDYLNKICLTSTTASKPLANSSLMLTGLAGNSGSWTNQVVSTKCSEYIEISDSLTNKKRIHSKIREVIVSGTVLDTKPRSDLFEEPASDCTNIQEPRGLSIKGDLETYDGDVFEMLMHYATYFQTIINETNKKTITVNEYKNLDHFSPDTYEKSIPYEIVSTQIVDSPILQKLLESSGSGQAKRKKISRYDYKVIGNAAIKQGEEIITCTDVIVLPNYGTEFYSDNTLAWSATSKVRWADLTNLRQNDIEDILITLFFKNLPNEIALFKLLSLDYKKYIQNLILNDELEHMKSNAIVSEIMSKNIPPQLNQFYQKVLNIIRRALKFLQDQYIPPVLAIYWAENKQAGFDHEDFENSIKNNPYYQQLYQILTEVDLAILEDAPIAKRIIDYRKVGGKDVLRRTVDISLSPTGYYRTNVTVDTIKYTSLFTLVKPLSIGAITVSNYTGQSSNQPTLPSMTSIQLPTNSVLTLIDIMKRLSTYIKSINYSSSNYIIPTKHLKERISALLPMLCLECSSFSLNMDARTGVSTLQVSYIQKSD